jgi:hypothetical protein
MMHNQAPSNGKEASSDGHAGAPLSRSFNCPHLDHEIATTLKDRLSCKHYTREQKSVARFMDEALFITQDFPYIASIGSSTPQWTRNTAQ